MPLGVPYYLHLYSASETPAHQYFYSTESTSIWASTRASAPMVSGSTGSAISWGGVSGLDTWTATDSLLYHSSDNELYLYGSSSPRSGLDHAERDAELCWPAAPQRGAAMGCVLQLHPTATVDGTEVLSVSRSLARPSFDMTNGSAATISPTGTPFSEPPLSSVSLRLIDGRSSRPCAVRPARRTCSTPPARTRSTSHALLGGSSLSYGFYTNSADLFVLLRKRHKRRHAQPGSLRQSLPHQLRPVWLCRLDVLFDLHRAGRDEAA